jgi:hypothetical protein
LPLHEVMQPARHCLGQFRSVRGLAGHLAHLGA